jgi:hypothetical protein
MELNMLSKPNGKGDDGHGRVRSPGPEFCGEIGAILFIVAKKMVALRGKRYSSEKAFLQLMIFPMRGGSSIQRG